jgi:hypothetical protein
MRSAKKFLHSICWMLATANFVPSPPIIVILMMEAIRSSETSILTRATWCNISENGILQYVSYSLISRKLNVQLGGEYCAAWGLRYL